MRRKRWEWREQAVTRFNVEAEAMSATAEKPTAPPPRPGGRGINYGPPPMAEFAKLGFDMEM